jgi:hypothetical protein
MGFESNLLNAWGSSYFNPSIWTSVEVAILGLKVLAVPRLEEILFQASFASCADNWAEVLNASDASVCSKAFTDFWQAEQYSTCAETTLPKDPSRAADANFSSNSDDG